MPSTTVPARFGNVPASRVMPVLRGAAGTGVGVTWEAVTGKPSTFPPTAHGHAIADVVGLAAALALLAPLESPAFTGTPTVPTAIAGTNTTQIASTQFVTSAVAAGIAGLIASSPAALDTLNELAAALGNDPNFASTISASLGNRLRIDAAQGLSAPQQAQGRDNLGLGAAALAATTDGVTEGSSNLYHTAARVRATTLTGLGAGSDTPIQATDGLLTALALLQAQVSARQATLVSGTNIKTINGASVLGSGDLTIASGATPAGSSGQVQYNNAGALGAAPVWVGTNTVEQYDGLNAQGSYVYNKRSSGSDYERFFTRWVGDALQIGTEVGGAFTTQRNVDFVIPGTDGSGATGAIRIWKAADRYLRIYYNYSQGFTIENPITQLILAGGFGTVVGQSPASQDSAWMFESAGIVTLGRDCSNAGFRFGARVTDSAAHAFTIAGQAAYSTAATHLAGGNLVFRGGAGASSSSGAAHGGHVKLAGGTGYGTGTKGRVILDAPNAAPQDSFLANGEVTLYLDQSTNKLMVRAKYSDGTLKTGEVAALT